MIETMMANDMVRLNRAIAELEQEVTKLRKFKAWVHAYLDEKCVPKEFPNGEHSKEGCRIGDRMDFVFAELERLKRSLHVEREMGDD